MIPKVTVLMPVYNGEKYIREAIESILNQSFANFEFLIIDDGSTDNSVKIIETHKDSRIRLVRNPENLQLVATLNKGISLAKSEYIARMDCDDISLPERLAKQVVFLDDNPEVGVLGTGFETIGKEGNVISSTQLPAHHNILQWLMYFISPIAHPTVMMRKTIILNANSYTSETIRGRERFSGEDYDLWGRLRNVTKLSNMQNILLKLRKHEKNVTQTYFSEHLINSAKISRLIISEDLGEEIPIEISLLLMNRDFKTTDDIIKINELIYKLYNNYVKAQSLSRDERRFIRKDVAKRLFSINVRKLSNPKLMRYVILALRLHPLVTTKPIIKHFTK